MRTTGSLIPDALKVSVLQKLQGSYDAVYHDKVRKLIASDSPEMERDSDILSLLLETQLVFTHRDALARLYYTTYSDFFDEMYRIISTLTSYEVMQTNSVDIFLTDGSQLKENLNEIVCAILSNKMEPDTSLLTSLHQEIQVALTYIEKTNNYSLMTYVRNSEAVLLHALKQIKKVHQPSKEEPNHGPVQ